MPEIDQDAVSFWKSWWAKWHRRVVCLTGGERPSRSTRRPRRTVRSTDVLTAWLRMYWPAMDPHYVLPPEWLDRSPEEKREAPRPTLRQEPQRSRPARERGPGWSMDDVGPYLKSPDGTIFRDRASAAHRLWRQSAGKPSIRQAIDLLPQRRGQSGRPIRARTPDRMLDALVALGLVNAGMSRTAAASMVLAWAHTLGRDPKKVAEGNTVIWRELHLPVRE